MRIAKFILFYLVFTALSVGAVLCAMRYIAVRVGEPHLFQNWLDDIGDGLSEAKYFITSFIEKSLGGI